MKRIILLSLIATVSFTACKKKKKEAPIKPITQVIVDRGTWLTVNEIRRYYNVNNTIIVSDTVSSGPKYIFSRKSDSVRLTESGKPTVYKKYSFSNTDNKQYISLSAMDGSNLQLFEILSATSKVMQWQKVESNVTINGQAAAKKVTTINFHCPCED